jgi:HSP20 family protein
VPYARARAAAPVKEVFMHTHLLVPRGTRRVAHPARRHAFPGLFADFDRLLDAFWGTGAPARRQRVDFAPPLDYAETEEEIQLAVELPGLEENDIRVSLEDGVLSIEGERADERSEEKDGFRHTESCRGSFRRRVRLAAEVDEEAVKAVYRNGVLNVTLPKVAQPGPEARTIPVTTS